MTVVEEGVTVNVAFKIFSVLLVAIIVPLVLFSLIFKILVSVLSESKSKSKVLLIVAALLLTTKLPDVFPLTQSLELVVPLSVSKMLCHLKY